jgi:hypothetical protein
MKRIIFSLLFIITLTSLVSSLNEQKCGDSYCNAGRYNVNGNEIEDASTCFQDCVYTDYTVCKVDLPSGGTCRFRGIDYQITNLIIRANPDTGMVANYSISFNGHTKEMSGISTGYYVQLADNVDILVESTPMAAFVTTDNIYLRGSIPAAELNDFYQVDNNNLDLMKDKEIKLRFTPKSNVSQPYCKLELKNVDTQESITSNNGLGCNNYWDISLDSPSFKPGKYVFIGQILDKNAKNKLGEKTLPITINGCLEDNECTDHNIFSYGLCQGNDIKICSYKTNYTIISVIVVIVLVILGIIAYFVFRKK